jgi:hypothetical protein
MNKLHPTSRLDHLCFLCCARMQTQRCSSPVMCKNINVQQAPVQQHQTHSSKVARTSSSSYGEAKMIDDWWLPCQHEGGGGGLLEGSDEYRCSAAPKPARGCGGRTRTTPDSSTWRGVGLGAREDKDDARWLAVEGGSTTRAAARSEAALSVAKDRFCCCGMVSSRNWCEGGVFFAKGSSCGGRASLQNDALPLNLK